MTTPTPAPDLKVYQILISALHPYPGNARIGNVEAIARSLQINGQFRPLVVRKETREILAGNHTWKAAKSLGWTHINVVFVEGITDQQAARIVLADNRTSDLAEYNVPDLTALLESLPTLDGTGFDNYVATNMEAAFQAPQETLRSNAEDALGAQPRTITCPNCHHVWEK